MCQNHTPNALYVQSNETRFADDSKPRLTLSYFQQVTRIVQMYCNHSLKAIGLKTVVVAVGTVILLSSSPTVSANMLDAQLTAIQNHVPEPRAALVKTSVKRKATSVALTSNPSTAPSTPKTTNVTKVAHAPIKLATPKAPVFKHKPTTESNKATTPTTVITTVDTPTAVNQTIQNALATRSARTVVVVVTTGNPNVSASATQKMAEQIASEVEIQELIAAAQQLAPENTAPVVVVNPETPATQNVNSNSTPQSNIPTQPTRTINKLPQKSFVGKVGAIR